ncbi:MAG: toprim domain-containing protein [Pseudomonadota bacterium]
MVAAVERGTDVVAVHRTYLAEPGTKAAIDTNKAMLGPVSGGAVRRSAGDGPLIVAEGIETALSLLDAFSTERPRVWAALSASGMASMQLPPERAELVIAPDGDPAGRGGAEKLADRAYAAGWSVRIMEPPGAGIDWNDIAMREAAHECA